MSTTNSQNPATELSPLEAELVFKVRAFHRLMESGMFADDPYVHGMQGSTLRVHDGHARREVGRRNQEIINLRKQLGITKKQQTALVNRAVSSKLCD